jgi:hypothetical protein
MLTLKVITTDSEGEHETHLFYGERISHKETESDNHTSDLKLCLEKNEAVISTTNLTETPSSKQAYYKSRVFIYGEGETPKQLLWILPCADCYIMHEGKTIDTFSSRFK